MKVPSGSRTIPVYIVVDGATLNDYRNESDEDILKAFKTYYNVRRRDFQLASVLDVGKKE